jgi:hypothetical protein
MAEGTTTSFNNAVTWLPSSPLVSNVHENGFTISQSAPPSMPSLSIGSHCGHSQNSLLSNATIDKSARLSSAVPTQSLKGVIHQQDIQACE